MAAPMYLISRTADPIFALFIGLGAAATRINREEKELNRSGKETLDSLCRYVAPEEVRGKEEEEEHPEAFDQHGKVERYRGSARLERGTAARKADLNIDVLDSHAEATQQHKLRHKLRRWRRTDVEA